MKTTKTTIDVKKMEAFFTSGKETNDYKLGWSIGYAAAMHLVETLFAGIEDGEMNCSAETFLNSMQRAQEYMYQNFGKPENIKDMMLMTEN